MQNETNNDSEMETDFFKVTPNQQLFAFGNVQKNDSLALSKREQDLLKALDEKRDLCQTELEKRKELTNRSYCTTPLGSDSTFSIRFSFAISSHSGGLALLCHKSFSFLNFKFDPNGRFLFVRLKTQNALLLLCFVYAHSNEQRADFGGACRFQRKRR